VYHVCYLFRVPSDRIERFLQISAAAAKVYRELGAVSSTVSRVTDGAAKYGCLGLLDVAPVRQGEELCVGVDSFADREGFAESMKKIDVHPRVIELYEQMTEAIDLSRTIRWEAEQMS
jgi:uncharacterized protein YbaA (DUF1428 family)